MDIFYRLLLGHLIADFTFQTNWIAIYKRDKWWVLLIHVLTHPVVYTVLCFSSLSQTWVAGPGFEWNGWMCLALITFFHGVQDVARIWAIREGHAEDSLTFLAWDQGVHLAFLIALSPAVSKVSGPDWAVGSAILIVFMAHPVQVVKWYLERSRTGASDALSDARKGREMARRALIVGGAALLAGLLK